MARRYPDPIIIIWWFKEVFVYCYFDSQGINDCSYIQPQYWPRSRLLPVPKLRNETKRLQSSWKDQWSPFLQVPPNKPRDSWVNYIDPRWIMDCRVRLCCMTSVMLSLSNIVGNIPWVGTWDLGTETGGSLLVETQYIIWSTIGPQNRNSIPPIMKVKILACMILSTGRTFSNSTLVWVGAVIIHLHPPSVWPRDVNIHILTTVHINRLKFIREKGNWWRLGKKECQSPKDVVKLINLV